VQAGMTASGLSSGGKKYQSPFFTMPTAFLPVSFTHSAPFPAAY